MRSLVVVAFCFITATGKYSRGYKRNAVSRIGMRTIEIAQEEIDQVLSDGVVVDWSVNATTAIKDQGSCGSCWAFSTIEGVESSLFLQSGVLPESLSTEELVDCDKVDAGCNGGDIPTACRYLERKNVDTDADYPDKSSKSGRTQSCSWDSGEYVAAVTSYSFAIPECSQGDCSNQDEYALAAALKKYGPLSICVNSGEDQTGDWAKYTSGIASGNCKAKAHLIDHCVQLVGVDTTASEPFWKVRNSWGSSWGEDGFIRLPFGQDNYCCVACEAVIIEATYTSTADMEKQTQKAPVITFSST
uniref:Peptidase C1A papain C-terminal domain-containing protein n=1 Tax=Aureoumbra lagunensis TaxID=44058 RepID=A0A7S3K3B7_9STRA|mmetsp:Transcript_9602/g.13290  ORF Transcript_9602/g.13290 Transcript_9602/m.13290 type:complete len:302 (-) Transcript_9602:184-1089(-)|eukprot:CAMPEP_0197307988 /NCGR_PEP_ID=MMETSP0891-20130614/6138_1 /TAXON_ID=44058 ORGANISM="Aureoumbra lagunensis, Strain CCMP1510" /NCGR_SAMPLE_ID=MMETSP0891 /ASSEMBLY_ACC=CAM_ASM_000534 /LENGTH=301 /DNA_ID=CAMNT_0042791951 /DNA_START=40 /DNA_END=945 /DNA_ORIENTATION=-